MSQSSDGWGSTSMDPVSNVLKWILLAQRSSNRKGGLTAMTKEHSSLSLAGSVAIVRCSTDDVRRLLEMQNPVSLLLLIFQIAVISLHAEEADTSEQSVVVMLGVPAQELAHVSQMMLGVRRVCAQAT
jgi:hypothetical protein